MGQRQSEIIKNHMEVYWHDYASASKGVPITEAGLVEKASVIGRTGLMLLECGTGAWRVRSSMNTLSRELGVTTTADIGLLSIEFTCFDGDQCYTQSLCLTNTGVNTSRLNRLEHFVNDFDREGKFMTGEELHSHLDEIERIHGLYSPIALGFAAALACGCKAQCDGRIQAVDALDLIEVAVQFFAGHKFSFPVEVVDEMLQSVQPGGIHARICQTE